MSVLYDQLAVRLSTIDNSTMDKSLKGPQRVVRSQFALDFVRASGLYLCVLGRGYVVLRSGAIWYPVGGARCPLDVLGF